MEESSTNHVGFNSRAAGLLNNQRFSDVEIRVKDGKNTKTFLAHKLFLSMSSPQFAALFYGKFESPKFITIFDFNPHTVYQMLQFLYTNKLDLHNVDEARQLYSLSKRYGIRVLQEKCIDFISKEELNTDNVLYMYDCAVREKFVGLLSRCQSVISSKTRAVLDSPVFVKVSASVIENILKMDNLTIESELDVLEAVVKWAQYQGTKKSLREHLEPFLPHLRFLTLEVKEFTDFVSRYDVLNAHETCLITRILIQPEISLQLPDCFCAVTKPRNSARSRRTVETNKSSASTNRKNVSRKESQSIKIKNNLVSPPSKQSFEFPLQESEKMFSTAFNGDVKSALCLKLLKGTIFVHSIVLKIDQQSSNDEEAFDVYMNISILNRNSSRSRTYDGEKVSEGAIVLNFNQPLKVIENNPMQIEILIEDLKLSRCSVVKNTNFELKWGSNVVANMTLTSNQMSESGENFFLISRLIYSPA